MKPGVTIKCDGNHRGTRVLMDGVDISQYVGRAEITLDPCKVPIVKLHCPIESFDGHMPDMLVAGYHAWVERNRETPSGDL